MTRCTSPSFLARATRPAAASRLFPGELPLEPQARKAAKPDLEALCLLAPSRAAPHGALLAVPSGSTAARQRAR